MEEGQTPDINANAKAEACADANGQKRPHNWQWVWIGKIWQDRVRCTTCGVEEVRIRDKN